MTRLSLSIGTKRTIVYCPGVALCPNLPSKNTQAGRLNIYASLAGKLVMAHVLDLLRLAGFDLKAVEAICEAYSKARKSLHDTGDHDLVNEIIALRILSLAKQGERDPDRLRAGALAALPITSAIGPLDAMGRRRGYSSDLNKNRGSKSSRKGQLFAVWE